MVYPAGSLLYTAEKAVQEHIATEHGSAFRFLLGLDKKLTGLTDHQRRLLELFYSGNSDADIAKELATTSTSTIRNHRFALRERQKQAKIFLAIMELLNQATPRKQSFVSLPREAGPIDERFAITEFESEQVLARYLPNGPEGPLTTFPSGEKRRLTLLRHIATFFEPGRVYTEKEVNQVLSQFYEDYALLRRYLVDYGFISRARDGSAYHLRP